MLKETVLKLKLCLNRNISLTLLSDVIILSKSYLLCLCFSICALFVFVCFNFVVLGRSLAV